jgi:serine/threonine-protein kinase
MKLRSPIITLLTGAALAVALWIASMTAATSATTGYGASATRTPTVAPTVAASSAAASTSPASSPSPTAAPSSPAPSETTSGGFVIPDHANYVGPVQAGGGAIAISLHDKVAIAYYCNGASIEEWMKGVPNHGHLTLTGKNGAHAEVDYALGHARGHVHVDGFSYTFSVIAVHKPSGLYQSIAVVRGATVKAGWIVLADGKEVGSLELDPNAAAPKAQKAPPLDLTTLQANDGGVTITATPIDAETGSGF